VNRASEVKFAERLKRHLESWARDVEQFRDDGDHPWVLDRSVSALNYFGGRDWEAVLSGQLHTWGHALNSSQAFAVNLFGPARFSKAVARALWNTLPAAGDGPGPTALMSTSSTAAQTRLSRRRSWVRQASQPRSMSL